VPDTDDDKDEPEDVDKDSDADSDTGRDAGEEQGSGTNPITGLPNDAHLPPPIPGGGGTAGPEAGPDIENPDEMSGAGTPRFGMVRAADREFMGVGGQAGGGAEGEAATSDMPARMAQMNMQVQGGVPGSSGDQTAGVTELSDDRLGDLMTSVRSGRSSLLPSSSEGLVENQNIDGTLVFERMGPRGPDRMEVENEDEVFQKMDPLDPDRMEVENEDEFFDPADYSP
jgi:hypothetical protein